MQDVTRNQSVNTRNSPILILQLHYLLFRYLAPPAVRSGIRAFQYSWVDLYYFLSCLFFSIFTTCLLTAFQIDSHLNKIRTDVGANASALIVDLVEFGRVVSAQWV